MEKFRELIHGWLGKVILAALLIPFAFLGLESYIATGDDPNDAAQVGDQTVSVSQVQNSVDAEKERLLKALNGDSSKINEPELYKKILESLIGQTSLVDLSKKLGFMPHPKVADDQLKLEAAFQENGVFSMQKLQQYLSETKIPQGELLKRYAQDIGVQQLTSGLVNSAYSTTGEAQKLNEIAEQKRSVLTILLQVQQFLNQVSVTDAEGLAYYNSHKQNFTSLDTADIDYYILNKSQFANNVTVPESAIQQKYNAYLKSVEQKQVQHILIATDDKVSDKDAKATANQVYDKIAKGGDFAQLAKQYSKDSVSAEKGGDLGTVTAGTNPAEFEAALNQLSVGQVSKPVKTQFGYHIIKLQSKNPSEQVESYAQLKPTFEAQLKAELIDGKYNEAINQLNDIAANAGDLKEIASKGGGSIQTKAGITKNQTASNLPDELNKINVNDVVFTDAATQDMMVSPGVSLDNDKTAWVQVKSYKPSKLQPYAVVATNAKNSVQYQKALDMAKAKAKKMANDINLGADPVQVAQQNNSEIANLGEVSRNSQGIPTKLLTVAFGLPTPKAGKSTAGTADSKNGSGIVVVSGVTTPQQTTQNKEFQNLLTNAYAQSELMDLMSYARSKEKVKVFKKQVSE